MAELVYDCPRCGSQKITFDVLATQLQTINYDWQEVHESFCICRHCGKGTIFVLEQKNYTSKSLIGGGKFVSLKITLNDYLKVKGFINTSNRSIGQLPEHLPVNVRNTYSEALKCQSIDCFNASGAMFRLCLDLATKGLLPPESEQDIPQNTRRDLGLRLTWLFDNTKIPASLRTLATCIKDDGNDGVHDGSLSLHEIEDLKDFTHSLLERIYTEPEKLKLAEKRRLERRSVNIEKPR
jgi:hypothetical protein